jgi:hypothetical protein
MSEETTELLAAENITQAVIDDVRKVTQGVLNLRRKHYRTLALTVATLHWSVVRESVGDQRLQHAVNSRQRL